MKPAISEIGILKFKQFHLGGLSQVQLIYALQGQNRDHR